MKNKQKGLAIPLLIAIVAVLVIGGGVYIYLKNKSESSVSPAVQTQNTIQSQQFAQQPVQATISQSETQSIAKASLPLAQAYLKMKTYKDRFGFSLSYPETWAVEKKSDGSVNVGTNSPASKTITIKEVSDLKVADSNGKWGSVSYYYSNGVWMRIGTNERDGSPTAPSPVINYPKTLSGLPIFDGATLSHGFGQYTYIVPLSSSKFLVITGGEITDMNAVQADGGRMLMSLVETISISKEPTNISVTPSSGIKIGSSIQINGSNLDPLGAYSGNGWISNSHVFVRIKNSAGQEGILWEGGSPEGGNQVIENRLINVTIPQKICTLSSRAVGDCPPDKYITITPGQYTLTVTVDGRGTSDPEILVNIQ